MLSSFVAKVLFLFPTDNPHLEGRNALMETVVQDELQDGLVEKAAV